MKGGTRARVASIAEEEKNQIGIPIYKTGINKNKNKKRNKKQKQKQTHEKAGGSFFKGLSQGTLKGILVRLD